MKPHCHICRTPANFLMSKDGFDEYLCPSCHLSFVFPQPTAEWLADHVYSFESGYQANKQSDLSLTKEDKRAREIFDFLVKRKSNGSFLDVGCSSGQYMFWAKERGFTCAGVEINKRTADIAKANGLNVYNGFLENSPFQKGSFDIIFMGDVIEHVNDPRSLIKSCQGFLKKDGLIVISTPNVDCLWSRLTLVLFKLFRIPWTSVTPPHHLFQFSFGNLGILMREQGFSSAKSLFAPPPSLKYELGSLHLYKKFKMNKTLGAFVFMTLAFGVYSLVYGLNLLLHPLLKKDFYMAVFYERN